MAKTADGLICRWQEVLQNWQRVLTALNPNRLCLSAQQANLLGLDFQIVLFKLNHADLGACSSVGSSTPPHGLAVDLRWCPRIP